MLVQQLLASEYTACDSVYGWHKQEKTGLYMCGYLQEAGALEARALYGDSEVTGSRPESGVFHHGPRPNAFPLRIKCLHLWLSGLVQDAPVRESKWCWPSDKLRIWGNFFIEWSSVVVSNRNCGQPYRRNCREKIKMRTSQHQAQNVPVVQLTGTWCSEDGKCSVFSDPIWPRLRCWIPGECVGPGLAPVLHLGWQSH
jgi:hypothetical protein